VAQAQAALERAEEDLRNSTIVSSMDGLVLSRDVEVGDAVSSILVLGSQATLVMTLGDVSEVYVLGEVDEADIGKVFLDQHARITVESFPDKKFEGKVTKISPMGVEEDNVTTFEVRVSIENPTGELKANMSANAEIILEEKQAVLLIPESAVIYDKERNATVEVKSPTPTATKAAARWRSSSASPTASRPKCWKDWKKSRKSFCSSRQPCASPASKSKSCSTTRCAPCGRTSCAPSSPCSASPGGSFPSS
jgi:multidrug efflux pump subunit AcrA (membrane-fusion protein)